MNPDALHRLRSDPVDWRYKGFPPVDGVTPANVARTGWNVFNGDLFLPALVLKESALSHNIEVMARWCTEHGVLLAPHGKTTMIPELFARQLAHGAWAITVATASQVRVCREFGVERIFLANELIEPAALRWVSAELDADPNFDFYCLVDSLGGVSAMEQARAGLGLGRPIQVLVELGYDGGRTGARTLEDAMAIAHAVARSSELVLSGVEGFEGLFAGRDDADQYLHELRAFLDHLVGTDAFGGRAEVILSAGGSLYFDKAADILRDAGGEAEVHVVLRSGCYVTHDTDHYERLSPFGAQATKERLQAALEVWAVVLARPEETRAILGMGKRDVGHDIRLPTPLQVYSESGLRPAADFAVVRLDDQHAYLELDASDPLRVGDLVACGVSHPCTTLDKWRLIPVVDDDYRVIDALHTFF